MLNRTISVLGVLGIFAVVANCGGSTSPVVAIDASTDTGGGACSPACTTGRACCNGTCVNVDNDPTNCGGCGVKCSGATPFCDGTCKAPPACTVDGGSCAAGAGSCCGSQCCASGDICCKVEGPVAGPVQCYTPTAAQPTCNPGCAPLCVSDREAKRDVVPVDPRAVLGALARVPMATWSYKTDAASVRHLGPMAQDFHAAFPLGTTDRAYDPIDAHGVAFASIQALSTMLEEQNARIERLERDNARWARECKGARP